MKVKRCHRTSSTTGAAPNQQAIPAVEYLMSARWRSGAKRFFLLGTDYVYPRTTNKIFRAFLHTKGVQDKDIEEVYTPFGYSDYQTIVSNIEEVRRRRKTAVVSTINGDSDVPFYKELANQEHPEPPIYQWWRSQWAKKNSVELIPNRWSGQLAAWNYFESLDNPTNAKFVADYRAYAKAHNLPNASSVVTNDPMEATTQGSNVGAGRRKSGHHRRG
ncbi:transporter substrate-binding protein [Pantoea ananatis]